MQHKLSNNCNVEMPMLWIHTLKKKREPLATSGTKGLEMISQIMSTYFPTKKVNRKGCCARLICNKTSRVTFLSKLFQLKW